MKLREPAPFVNPADLTPEQARQREQNMKAAIAAHPGNGPAYDILKQQADPAWLYIYKNLEFKEKLVMDKLKTMVKLVDPKDESKEEATDDASKEKTEAEPGASGVTEPESVPGAAN